MTTTTITCEANVSKRQTTWGWEPVTCGQSIGLTTLVDAAGVTHRACARFGHRDDLVRRFGMAPEEPAEPDWTMPSADCQECIEIAGGFGPRHVASPRCESGKRPHCTCDTCF